MIPHNQKATDEQIKEAYSQTKSVWRAAEILKMGGQSVHERLVKLGVDTSMNLFTKDEINILKARYQVYRDAGKLKDLAKSLGRTTQFICRKAKKLGLTDYSHKRLDFGKWKYMEIDVAQILFDKFKKSGLGLSQFCKKFIIPLSGFTNTMRKFFFDEWDHVIELKTPKQSKYRLGRHVEYSVRDDFKKHGYVVMRSPASKSPIDVLAVKKGIVVFIQCKRNMVIGVSEWNILYDLAASVGAIPIVAGRPTGRGLLYWEMTNKKDGSKKRQPKQDIKIEEIGRI